MRLTKRSTDAIRAAKNYTTHQTNGHLPPGDRNYQVWVMVYDENNQPMQLQCSSGPMLYESYSRAARAVERINPAIRWTTIKEIDGGNANANV